MIFSYKSASLVAGVLQQTALVLMIRYSKTRPHEDDNTIYLTSVAVWTAEIVKLFLAIALETSSSNSWLSPVFTMVGSLCTPDSYRLFIPAVFYAIQNNLLFYALENLSIPTFQVTNQGKLLTTAILSRIMLQKPISNMQYVSLMVLGLGVALVNLSEAHVDTSTSSDQNHFLGLVAVVISCLTSGFCGVYFALILQSSAASVHARNFQLAFWSILIATGRILYHDMAKVSKMGLFQGFDGVVVIVVICQALTGLMVSLIIKYADVILKGFTTSVAVVLATVISIFVFDAKIELFFYIGATMVGAAVKIYSSYPPEQSSIHKEDVEMTEKETEELTDELVDPLIDDSKETTV